MIIATFVFRTQAQISLQQLPLDESEAYSMLRDGSLDSATWEIVRPFYQQPLCVPCGELKELVDVVPEIGHDAPFSKEELASYEPWGKKEIARFFSDHPALANFKPVLSFETSPKSRTDRVHLGIRNYDENDPQQSAGFSISPGSGISVLGNAQFKASSAQWERRTILARIPCIGTFTLGNFNLNLDNGLLYGYFPQTSTDSGFVDNWRYSQAATWNGVLYEGAQGSVVHEKLFFHRRMSETAYGIQCGVALLDHLAIEASGSRLLAKPTALARADSAFYGDMGITFKNKRWDAGAFVGAAQGRKLQMPMYVYVNNKGCAKAFDFSYTWFPAGISASHSALRHEFFTKIHAPDSIRADVHCTALTIKLPIAGLVQSTSGVSSYYCVNALAAEAFTGVLGNAWLDFAIRYGYSPFVNELGQRHSLTVSLERHAFQGVQYRLNGRFLWAPERYTSMYVRQNLSIACATSLELAPFCTVYSVYGKALETSVGITQTLRLFEKTWSEVKIEIPVTKQNKNAWVLDAKADFYL